MKTTDFGYEEKSIQNNHEGIKDFQDSTPSPTSPSEKDSLLSKNFHDSQKDEPVERDIRTGSVFSAIFNLTNAPMGTGLLSMAYSVYSCGLVTSLIILLLIILLQLGSHYTLIFCSFKAGGMRSYQDCVYHYLGNFWKNVCATILAMYVTGVCIVYMSVLGQFIQPVTLWLFPELELLSNRKYIIIVISCVVIFPLTLWREIKKLSFASIIAIIGALYLTVYVVVYGITRLATGHIGDNIGDVIVFNRDLSFGFYPLTFLAIPMICFCYQSQTLMLPITYEIKNGTTLKSMIVSLLSTFNCTIIYVSIGVFGFLTFGTNTKDNITQGYSPSDIFANLCRFGCGLNVILSYPVQNFAGRSAITTLFFRKKELELPGHIILSIVYFSVNLVVALFVPNLSVVFSFIGAIGAVSLMFFFPSLLMWKILSNYHTGIKKILIRCLSVFYMFVSVFFCVTGVGASVFNLIKSFQPKP